MGSKEGFGVFLRNWGSAFSFVSIFLDADSQEEKKLDQFVEDDDDEDEASPGSWHRQRTALRTAVEGGQRSSSAPWISTQQKTWLTRSWAAFWMLLVPLSSSSFLPLSSKNLCFCRWPPSELARTRQEWFGNKEAFTEYVRSRLGQAVMSGFSANTIPIQYQLLVITSEPWMVPCW